MQRLYAQEARHWATTSTAAIAALAPWLWVLASGHDKLDRFTSWMQRHIELLDILAAWAQHLARIFVDLSPQPEPWTMLLLLPPAWKISLFVLWAPRPAGWLLVLIALTYIAVVIGPDCASKPGEQDLQAD